MKHFVFTISFFSFLLGTANVYSVPNFEKDKKIDFANVDKNEAKWQYVLNGYRPEFLPELYRDGKTNYLPVEIVKHLGATLEIDAEQRMAYIANNNDTFILKEGSKQIYPNNKLFQIHEVPIWKNNTLYVSTNFLIAAGAVISENKFTNQLNIIKNYNNLNEVVSLFDASEGKIIFNLNQLPVFETRKEEKLFVLTLYGSNIKEKEKIKRQLEEIKRHFSDIIIDDERPGLINITFKSKTKLGMVNTFLLERSGKLVIQIPRLYFEQKKELTEKSLYHLQVSSGDYLGPLSLNILEADPARNLEIKPFLARDQNKNFTLRELSQLKKETSALAAVNGGYFSGTTKTPLGLLVVDGEVFTGSIYNRSALIQYRDNSFGIKNLDLSIILKTEAFSGAINNTKLNALNQPPQKNQLVLFTPAYGSSTRSRKKEVNEAITSPNSSVSPEPEFVEYIFRENGQNIVKAEKANPEIPTDGFVVYASGTAISRLETILENTRQASFAFQFNSVSEPIKNALAAGPTLLKEKKIEITATQEKFQKDITEGRAPRTAVGIFSDQRLFLLAADGRQAESRGMTLEELAYFFKKYGLKEAINLDGGGSTQMLLNDKILNSPADGRERKISNGLFLFIK